MKCSDNGCPCGTQACPGEHETSNVIIPTEEDIQRFIKAREEYSKKLNKIQYTPYRQESIFTKIKKFFIKE